MLEKTDFGVVGFDCKAHMLMRTGLSSFLVTFQGFIAAGNKIEADSRF